MISMARLYRRVDAAAYLGMSPPQFDRLVRPSLQEVWLGPQMLAFDRIELDAWVDEYRAANGRPAGEKLCQDVRPVSTAEAETGGSTSESLVMEDWRKVRDRVI